MIETIGALTLAIQAALRGVPKTASAQEVNKRLRAASIQHDYSYSTFRRYVRAVQHERAKWAEWEGADNMAITRIRPSKRVTRPKTRTRPKEAR